MKPTPRGWPRVSVAVFYQDASKAIDWLVKAFGFEVRLKVEGEGGLIEHSELTFGEGVIMVSEEKRNADLGRPGRSPRTLGGTTQGIMIYVDDVEAHCKRARAAGGHITIEPKVSDYGEEYWSDKSYEVEDLDGHRWWFAERLRG